MNEFIPVCIGKKQSIKAVPFRKKSFIPVSVKKGDDMPLVSVKVFKGALTNEQKAQIQTKITDIMTEIEGKGKEEFRQHVWVVIEEIEDKNWSFGAVPGSLELLKAFVDS